MPAHAAGMEVRVLKYVVVKWFSLAAINYLGHTAAISE